MSLTRRRFLTLLPALTGPHRLLSGQAIAAGEPSLHPQLRQLAVGAYYFAWYRRGHPRWRPNLRLRFLPQGGAYASDDPSTVDRHLALCERYGIDVLGVNWHNWNSLDDEALAGTFRDRVRRTGIRFFVNDDLAIAFGGADRLRRIDFAHDAAARRFLHRQGEYLASRYMEHPNYLLLRGRPVVELYVSRAVRAGFGALAGSFAAGVRGVLGRDPYLLLDEIWWERTTPEGGAAEYADHLRYADAISAWTLVSERVLEPRPGSRAFASSRVWLPRSSRATGSFATAVAEPPSCPRRRSGSTISIRPGGCTCRPRGTRPAGRATCATRSRCCARRCPSSNRCIGARDC